MKYYIKVCAASLVLTSLLGNSSANAEELSPISLHDLQRVTTVDLLKQTGRFDTLLQLVAEAGLEGSLRAAKSGLLVAPTDEAFAQIPAEALESLRNNPQALKRVLLAHFSPNGSAAVGIYAAALGTDVKVSVRFPGQSKSLNLPGFVNGVVSPEIFLIEYRSGNRSKSSRITSTEAPRLEVMAISKVLDVPAKESYAQLFSSFRSGPFRFSKLRELLSIADIPLDALRGKTLLAPTNAAIERLGEEVIARFASDPAELREILLFHVVDTPRSLANLVKASNNISLPKGTAEVEGLKIRIKGQASVAVADLFIEDATYVHGIDAVLLPIK